MYHIQNPRHAAPIFNYFVSTPPLDPNDPYQIHVGDCFYFYDHQLNLTFVYIRLDDSYVFFMITKSMMSTRKQTALSKVVRTLGLVFRPILQEKQIAPLSRPNSFLSLLQ
jgi:hypothetical protein